MLIGMARGIHGGVIGKGISEGASKKNLVVFLFGDVLGHSFFFFLKNMQCFCYNYLAFRKVSEYECEVKPFVLKRIYF